MLFAEDAHNHFAAEYWLAIAKCRVGPYTRCAALLEEIIEQQPTNLDALRARYNFARDNNDWTSANNAELKLIANIGDPASIEYCRLGDSYLHLRRLREAEGPLRQGLQRDPYSFLCHRDLGELDKTTARNAEAQQELELVVRLFPEVDFKTYLSLALVYRAEGKTKKAHEVLSKGERLFPNESLLKELNLKD